MKKMNSHAPATRVPSAAPRSSRRRRRLRGVEDEPGVAGGALDHCPALAPARDRDARRHAGLLDGREVGAGHWRGGSLLQCSGVVAICPRLSLKAMAMQHDQRLNPDNGADGHEQEHQDRRDGDEGPSPYPAAQQANAAEEGRAEHADEGET